MRERLNPFGNVGRDAGVREVDGVESVERGKIDAEVVDIGVFAERIPFQGARTDEAERTDVTK